MISEFEKYVVQAMINFYNYDFDMFLEYLDENVIWYGPKQGQYIVGKDNLAKALHYTRNDHKFHVDNVTTKLISYSSNIYSILVTYRLYSKFSDNTVREYLQHVVVNGQKCRDQNGMTFWRCPFIHVSNVMPDEKCVEFQLSRPRQDSVSRMLDGSDTAKRRLVLPGDNYTSVYIQEDTIRYIVGGKGIMCYVHTDNDVYLVRRLLKDVQQQLPDYFYRCHSSYIVNLRNVVFLSSHRITLNDSTEIPISVKRYPEIKQKVNEWMESLPPA